MTAGKSFFVVFVPSCTAGFENLGVLCTLSFLPSQESLPVLCIISFMVGTPKSGLLSFSGDGLEQFILCGVLQITWFRLTLSCKKILILYQGASTTFNKGV